MPPLPTSCFPTSNCGLISATSSPRRKRRDRRQDQLQRDERDVDGDELDRLVEVLRLQIARVDLLAIDHARIVAQRDVELSVADVDRVHLRRAVLQHHVREAARRRADVRADFPVAHRSRTPSARARASSRRARPTDAPAPRRAPRRPRRPSPRPCRRTAPFTRTRRAMISDCAFERVSTSPRSTSATSRRCFFIALTTMKPAWRKWWSLVRTCVMPRSLHDDHRHAVDEGVLLVGPRARSRSSARSKSSRSAGTTSYVAHRAPHDVAPRVARMRDPSSEKNVRTSVSTPSCVTSDRARERCAETHRRAR